MVDDQGNVLETFDYYPFGLLMPKRNTASANTTEKFSSKELDEETNQYYFGARYYDPALGRFFVPDRFADKYPSMTPYQYAANNPIGFIDINGDSVVYRTRKEAELIARDLNSVYKEIYGSDNAFSVEVRKTNKTIKDEDGNEKEFVAVDFAVVTNEAFDWDTDRYTKAAFDVFNADFDITGTIQPDKDGSLLENYGGGRVTSSTSFVLSGQLSNYGDPGTVGFVSNPSKWTYGVTALHELTYHLHPLGSKEQNRTVEFRGGGVLIRAQGPNIMRTKYKSRRGVGPLSIHPAGPYSNLKRY